MRFVNCFKISSLALLLPSISYGAETTIADLEANDIVMTHLLETIKIETQAISKYAHIFSSSIDFHTNVLLLLTAVGIVNIGLLVYLIKLVKQK